MEKSIKVPFECEAFLKVYLFWMVLAKCVTHLVIDGQPVALLFPIDGECAFDTGVELMLDRPFNRHIRIETVLVELDTDSDDDDSTDHFQSKDTAMPSPPNSTTALSSQPSDSEMNVNAGGTTPPTAKTIDPGCTDDISATTAPGDTLTAKVPLASSLDAASDATHNVEDAKSTADQNGFALGSTDNKVTEIATEGVANGSGLGRPERRRRRRPRAGSRTRVQVDVVAPFEVHRILSELKHDDELLHEAKTSGPLYLGWILKDMVCCLACLLTEFGHTAVHRCGRMLFEDQNVTAS